MLARRRSRYTRPPTEDRRLLRGASTRLVRAAESCRGRQVRRFRGGDGHTGRAEQLHCRDGRKHEALLGEDGQIVGDGCRGPPPAWFEGSPPRRDEDGWSDGGSRADVARCARWRLVSNSFPSFTGDISSGDRSGPISFADASYVVPKGGQCNATYIGSPCITLDWYKLKRAHIEAKRGWVCSSCA